MSDEWRKINFDFKSRQTKQKKQEVGGQEAQQKKKEEKRQKARALHEVFMLCFVLFKTEQTMLHDKHRKKVDHSRRVPLRNVL